LLVYDSGDIVQRSIRIRFRRDPPIAIRVAKDNLAIAFDPLEGIGISKKIPIAVTDRNPQQLPLREEVGERRVRRLSTEIFELADIFQADVSEQRSRQQSGFGQYLKTIAYAENQTALFSKSAIAFITGENFASAPVRR